MIGRQRGCYARIDDPLGRWGNVSPTGITTTGFTVGSGINDSDRSSVITKTAGEPYTASRTNWGSYTTLDDPLEQSAVDAIPQRVPKST
jgi:hypothetical protein